MEILRYSMLRRGGLKPGPERGPYPHGWTLTEMLVVLVIVGLAATVALPSLLPASTQRLDVAVAAVADAVRFAREQARLTGVVHGVRIDATNDRLQVFRLDELPDPNVPVLDVYHPVKRNLYVLRFDAAPFERVSIGGPAGNWIGACDQTNNVGFTAEGATICTEPTSTRLEDARVDVAVDGSTASVAIDRLTGRVTVL